jgi:hypothetical protein
MCAVAVASVGACARPRARLDDGLRDPQCALPLTEYLRTSIYLDRSNTRDPLRPFSEDEWQRFIDEVLIRYLPAGGTVFDNTGWWRRPNGTTFRGIGRTFVVLDPVADSTAHRTGAIAVVDAIKSRYGHQLVIREEARVCAQF